MLKPPNGEFENSKSTFSLVFTSVKLQLNCNYTHCFYIFHKAKRNLMQEITVVMFQLAHVAQRLIFVPKSFL